MKSLSSEVRALKALGWKPKEGEQIWLRLYEGEGVIYVPARVTCIIDTDLNGRRFHQEVYRVKEATGGYSREVGPESVWPWEQP